ncbi:MAG TPA: CDP-alcohol phosphatidyltransferase family protein [Anaerolineaceae bacterium]|nr:CDP-alcohol phosphatidyltransferase family protein [Anaerolineaceae bacterium]
MPEVKSHTRINDILLGPLERPALQWLAARMPAWVTSDMLTGLGFFAAVLIFASYALTNLSPHFLWLASFGFLLNWFGDSLDGSLARYRKVERPQYGYFIDHTTDAAAVTLIILGIGVSPYLKFNLAAITLIGYLLLSIMVYITTYVNGVFRVSYAHIGPTEVRAIAIIANTVLFFAGNPKLNLPAPLGETGIYDLVAIVLATALIGAYTVVLIVQAVQLNKIDRAQLKAAPAGKQALRPAKNRKARRAHAASKGNLGTVSRSSDTTQGN